MKYNIDNRLKDTAIVNLTDFLNVIDLYEDDETVLKLLILQASKVLL